jgi:hypothetical protein
MSSHEYNQLLKFLYFEGYVDSYAEAEELLESMSDEEFEDLLEKHSFPLKPSERRSVENIGRMLSGDYSVPPGGSTRTKSAKKAEEPQEQPKPRKRTTDLKKVRMGEEFEDLTERKYGKDEPLPGSGQTPSQKMYKKRAQHGARVMLGNPALGRNRRSDPESDSYRERASTMDTVKKAQDAGEEPRDSSEFKNTIAARRRPRASYEVPNERPGGLRAKATKAGGYRTLTRKEELEIQEGLGRYQTSAGHWKDRDENPSVDDAVSDMLQKRREAAAKKAAQERLKAKGKVPTKGGNPVFEEVIEYLFVEGFADTIENAEVMAENISETWVNEIMEAYVDLNKKTGEMRRRANRTLFVKGDWERANKIDTAREKHDPAKVQAKAAANRKKGSVTEENYEIDEAAKDQSDKQIDQGVKKTYKAGNVLDNTHQGRSPGLNKLPRSERDAKVERMRSRLKARRDDLFQERGNREDAKRAELKKLLGL